MRTPLLQEVLQSSHLMHENAQLVIELKGKETTEGMESEDEKLATELIKLFVKSPDLTERIAVIMSFNRDLIVAVQLLEAPRVFDTCLAGEFAILKGSPRAI